MRTFGWRVSETAMSIWILLSLSCFPAIQALKLQQLTLLVAFLVAASMYALLRGRFVLAGILLAVTTIKPQLVFLLIAWLFIWILGEWRKRQRVFWSFTISLMVLVVEGEFLLPGWVADFYEAAKDYRRYTGGGNLMLDLLPSSILGEVVSVFVVGMVLIFAWRTRHASEETLAFQWFLCFTLATTLLVIRFSPYNEMLLLPGVMMAVRARSQLWTKNRVSRFFCAISAFAVFFPFFAAICLIVALALLPSPAVQRVWDLPLYANLAIPVTIYGLLLASRNLLAALPRASFP
jgi:hypothetical protein